jgi:hypothetical protein
MPKGLVTIRIALVLKLNRQRRINCTKAWETHVTITNLEITEQLQMLDTPLLYIVEKAAITVSQCVQKYAVYFYPDHNTLQYLLIQYRDL